MNENNEGVRCPHCGAPLARTLSESANGRRVAIAWMIHLGWQMKDIAVAFGIKPSGVHELYKKIRKEYAKSCNFIDWRLNKQGKKVLKGFYREGKYYSICPAGEYRQYRDDGTTDWDAPELSLPDHALHEVWWRGEKAPEVVRVFDLSDWTRLGFVFAARSK